jgi:GTP-binding protein
MSHTPAVAIVGRPNVGKSTLFNRLVGRRQAIVHDQPGVTRDRIVGQGRLEDGRPLVVVDTGGLVDGEDPLGLNQQVWLAIEECDLVLFVVDGKAGPTPGDGELARQLRRTGKQIVLVVNKADTKVANELFAEFYQLGIEPQLLLSAEHGTGLGDLVEVLAEALPGSEAAPEPADETRVALVGRPNVGKSSILNRLVGSSRSLVSPTPGTTRDPVDTLLEADGAVFRLIDTAGIRRRSRAEGTPEELALMMARRQIEQADVACLVVEAQLGVTSGDLAVAGIAWDLGRAVVVLVNKWDLRDLAARDILEESWPKLETLTANAERVNVSAVTGRGIEKILPAVDRAVARYRTVIPTAELNRLTDEIVARHHPPAAGGRPWRVLYATQVSTGPPTFMLFANRTLPRTSSYRKYLENSLRDRLGLAGVPVRLVVRRRGAERRRS